MALNIKLSSVRENHAYELTKLAVQFSNICDGKTVEEAAENVAKFFNTLIGDETSEK